jgi:hypothetical protein
MSITGTGDYRPGARDEHTAPDELPTGVDTPSPDQRIGENSAKTSWLARSRSSSLDGDRTNANRGDGGREMADPSPSSSIATANALAMKPLSEREAGPFPDKLSWADDGASPMSDRRSSLSEHMSSRASNRFPFPSAPAEERARPPDG